MENTERKVTWDWIVKVNWTDKNNSDINKLWLPEKYLHVCSDHFTTFYTGSYPFQSHWFQTVATQR